MVCFLMLISVGFAQENNQSRANRGLEFDPTLAMKFQAALDESIISPGFVGGSVSILIVCR